MVTPAGAVFDLDGVVTFTARVHAAAWKQLFNAYLHEREARYGEPFRAFTDEEYHALVDGRPRYEGAREFLTSRGITLPYGDPTDPPDRETFCGIGNRKNELFNRQLDEQGVDVDEQAVRFIQELRAAGVRVGMASSSKNAEAILQRAGLTGLFDARVDGVYSERIGLKGKPAPDIFLECVELLGRIEPANALMAEDATVGVAAGRAGGFGLVIGVDRGKNWLALRENGADWIIRDFAEMSVDRAAGYLRNRAHVRPNALFAWQDIAHELTAKRVALFLDYDGTLTPIVGRPDLATLSDGMRARLHEVAQVWPTAIVSGRGREDVTALVGLPDLIYAASHGFDVSGPGGLRLEVDPELAPLIAQTAETLRSATAHIPGVLVEDKKFSVAVHYRLVPAAQVPEVEALVDEAAASNPELEKTVGKMVFELRPARDWDKGKAVLWLMNALGLDTTEVVPVYIGDDTTDEDAFHALEGRGIGIVVMEMPRATAARYSLQNVEEVGMLLERLTRLNH